MTISGLYDHSGDVRNTSSINNGFFYNSGAANGLKFLWTYFLTTIERVYKMSDLLRLSVAMLPYDIKAA